MENEVNLFWETRDNCVGYVRYGTDSESLNSVASDEEGSSSRKDHTVVLKNLNARTDYYVIFYSGDQTFGQSGQPLVVRID
jgi:hypothetical protein